MFLSGISDWLSDIADSVTGALDWIGDAAMGEVNRWRTAYSTFRTQLAQLQATPPTSTAAAATRNSLLARGKDISDRAQWIETQLTNIMSALGLGGLGVLPLIVPAVVIAAIAAVTILIYKWSDDVASYLREQRATNAGIASGMTPAQAVTAAQQSNPKSAGIFGDIAGVMWPLAIGAAALYFMREPQR